MALGGTTYQPPREAEHSLDNYRAVSDSPTPPHVADPKFPKKSLVFTPFLLLEAWIAQALVRGRLGKLLVLIFGIVILI